MHVIFRESHGLEENETPVDLGQSPGDLVVLSFSDGDLGAFATAWHEMSDVARDLPSANGAFPTLRVANLAALKHPLSVDTYVEQTLTGCKAILIRLIGGLSYWSYGIQQIEVLARENGIALAVLPGDGRADPRLDQVSTLPVATLRHLSRLCDQGGVEAAKAALTLLVQQAGFIVTPTHGDETLPQHGFWTPERGVSALTDDGLLKPKTTGRILICFYRSYLSADDLAPVKALFAAFRARGYEVITAFVPSLKAPDTARWLSDEITRWKPDAIVNATAFSGKGNDGASPLDAGNVPVFQVTLATSTQKDWESSERGLSPGDLAMHVVLPEVDGRISAGVASFKEPDLRDEAVQFARLVHRPVDDRITAITARVHAWVVLAQTPVAQKRLALVLSTYPGKDWQMAHAVGLDALASAEAICEDLQAEGYDVPTGTLLAQDLPDATISWPIEAYQKALATLPAELQSDLEQSWGAVEQDPSLRGGAFHFRAVHRGKALIALQPERGNKGAREDDYHDLSRTPCHSYVAFYLWLNMQIDAHVLVHIGAHGTLEWLPGKSVALSQTCWPEALIGDLPVIYPFIVNDPGEAAQAKRRISAVTLGHIPPPMRPSETPDQMVRLESLLDEFSNADGLDPKRRDRLQDDIRSEAQALGVEDDLGLERATSKAEAITRIDRFVCDIKESQYGEGLHIYGRAPADAGGTGGGPSARLEEGGPLARVEGGGPPARDPFSDLSVRGEQQGLRDALDGRWVAAGPSGSPYRGRSDVLPTGRNLFTTDPRSVPTRAAYAQGVRLAEELVRRHLQEKGDWPKGLIIDLWGSATMRTAGEEFAMALHLLGVKPVWDDGSTRVSGIEVVPISDLERPRLDVTLRVSGLFRDVFPGLTGLFAQAVRTLSARDEAADWNPFVGPSPGPRVYGPGPGRYGVALEALSERYEEGAREAAGEAWLAASAWALQGDNAVRDGEGIANRVAKADSFVHVQDLPETDLLLAADYANHEGGFAAAKALSGGKAALYHLDTSNPDTPRARPLAEEIARVVRARATNPGWIKGMARHGFRGAAEIAATLDHMASFAHLADAVAPHLFDLYHDATLGDPEVVAFMQEANSGAYAAMQERFQALYEAGLWQTRRNSIRVGLTRAQSDMT